MSRAWVIAVLAVGLAGACKEGPPTPAEVAERGWHVHALAIAAGERAPTCAAAGAAMQITIAANRQAFVDAVALDDDKARLAEATAWLEAHSEDYADLEARMEALADRCADDLTVQAAFRLMETP